MSPNSLKKVKQLSNLKNYSIGSYHNLLKLVDKSRDFQTNETPNVLGIYLLANVVSDFLKIGISSLRKRLDDQAHMLYSYFSKQSLPPSEIELENLESQPIARTASFASMAFIKEERYRSVTTPVFETVKGCEGLRKFAAGKGLILGAGYKDFKNKQSFSANQHLRIGNFPALTEKDFKKLTRVLEKF